MAIHVCGDGGSCAHAHVRSALPYPGTKSGNDRACPICHGNLSVNPADDPRAHIVITCHGEAKCTETAGGRAQMRRLLTMQYGVPESCLGPFGLGGNGPSASTPRPQRDPALLAAAARDGAYDRLRQSSVGERNPSIVFMCMQVISESDGAVIADPEHLLPTDPKLKAEFVAIARRTGIDRIQADTLAKRWFSRWVAEVKEPFPVPPNVRTSRSKLQKSNVAGQSDAA